MPPVKDILASKAIRVDIISCRCGQVYIGQTDRSIGIREKEPRGHISPYPSWQITALAPTEQGSHHEGGYRDDFQRERGSWSRLRTF